MNIKNFLKIYFLSFFSRELYFSVAKDWKNWGLAFLIRFSFFSSVLLCLVAFIILANKNFDELHYIFDQLPALKLNKGEAKLINEDVSLPKEIRDYNNIVIGIVDLNIADPAEKYNNIYMVFTKDRLTFNLFSQSSFEVFYSDLEKYNNLSVLDANSLIDVLKSNQHTLLVFIPLVAFSLLTIILFALLFIKSVLYSFPASLIAKLFNYSITFKEITRVAVVINAPADTIFLIITIFSFIIPSEGFTSFAQFISSNIYLAYFIYIYVSLIRHSKNKIF